MFSHLIIKIWIYINLWGTRLEKTDSEKLNISFREVITNTFNLHDGQTGNANVIEVRQNFIKECIPVTCKTDLVLFLAKVKVWEQEKNSYKTQINISTNFMKGQQVQGLCALFDL